MCTGLYSLASAIAAVSVRYIWDSTQTSKCKTGSLELFNTAAINSVLAFEWDFLKNKCKQIMMSSYKSKKRKLETATDPITVLQDQ